MGIKLVRIFVHEDDFDKVNSLINYLCDNPEEIGTFDEVRKEYGHLKWTHGTSFSRNSDRWIEVHIERYEFMQLHKYGSYWGDIWQKIMKEDEKVGSYS